ncbi:MAG: tetratricopeptide repeat protein [Gammaproteobacteria bacterium]
MMSHVKNLLLLCGGLMVLSACSLSPEAPTDVTDGMIPPAEQIRPDASTSAAIRQLIESARQASLQGDMGRAESFLERAIRIEPKNPLLWHYLAKLHLHQGRYQRAEGLAAKSTSLAPASDGLRLRADNWRIIAHARQQQGDSAGALKAQQAANQLLGGAR